MRAINIPVKSSNFYKVYLEFLNPILKLTYRETEILAELVYWNFQYANLDKKIKDKLVFDYDTKMKIVDKLGITHQILLNNITQLRKKGWVEKTSLSEKFLSLIDNESKMVVVKFTII